MLTKVNGESSGTDWQAAGRQRDRLNRVEDHATAETVGQGSRESLLNVEEYRPPSQCQPSAARFKPGAAAPHQRKAEGRYKDYGR